MKYLFIVSLIAISIVLFRSPTKEPAFAEDLITPTYNCIANIPCTSPLPTNTYGTPTIFQAITTSPTKTNTNNTNSSITPCIGESQASIQHTKRHKRHHKHHRGHRNGWISRYIQHLIEFILSLLKQLGITIPNLNTIPVPGTQPGKTPCPTATITTTQPSPSTNQTQPSPSITTQQPTATTVPTVTVSPTITTPPLDTTAMTFSDEFTGPANALPDTTKWVAEVGAKMRNNEDQYYTPFSNKNAFLDGQGNLVIEARRESYNGYSFTSAALDSTYSQQYGRIEWRARMDSLQSGIWPALWTYSKSGGWPQGGELDMMEWFADPNNPTAEANIHASDSGTDHPWGGQKLSSVDITQWNVYSVEWRPTFIDFKVNGQTKAYIASNSWGQGWASAFTNRQNIIINIAMNNGGVSWMGSNARLKSDFSKARLYVDYVRVYK